MSPPSTPRVRLDVHLVALGLAESRERAQALIRAGQVLVNDQPVDKPGTPVAATAAVRLRGDINPFVSRGGLKLSGGLDLLGVDVTGVVALDVGASTGGFTDCLLQRGAARVYAVDVGYGQLAWKLRTDDRVVCIERTNVRTWDGAGLREPVTFVVVDASFISLRLLLPNIARLAPRAPLVALVKPQFEVGRGKVGKGGVVRDDALRGEAVREVVVPAAALGYRLCGQVDAPLAGPKGNREILVHLVPN